MFNQLITLFTFTFLYWLLCRWGNLPVDDALQFGHVEVVKLLKEYQQVCEQQEMPHTKAEHSPKLDTIEGMV